MQEVDNSGTARRFKDRSGEFTYVHVGSLEKFILAIKPLIQFTPNGTAIFLRLHAMIDPEIGAGDAEAAMAAFPGIPWVNRNGEYGTAMSGMMVNRTRIQVAETIEILKAGKLDELLDSVVANWPEGVRMINREEMKEAFLKLLTEVAESVGPVEDAVIYGFDSFKQKMTFHGVKKSEEPVLAPVSTDVGKLEVSDGNSLH